MAKSKTQPPLDPYSPEVIELMIEYRRVAQRGQRHPGHGSHDRAPARHLQGLARHEQGHDRAADTRLLKDAGAIGRREKKKGSPKAA
jgi:hypothetical protein